MKDNEPKTQRTWRATEPNSQNSNHYIHGVSQSRRSEQWDARMGCEYAVISRQAHVGKQYYRQRGCRSITFWIDGTSPSSCTARRTAEWSIEEHYRHVRCSRGNKHEGVADWPQNTNKVRLTTKTMIEETPQLEDIRNRRRSGMSDS